MIFFSHLVDCKAPSGTHYVHWPAGRKFSGQYLLYPFISCDLSVCVCDIFCNRILPLVLLSNQEKMAIALLFWQSMGPLYQRINDSVSLLGLL